MKIKTTDNALEPFLDAMAELLVESVLRDMREGKFIYAVS